MATPFSTRASQRLRCCADYSESARDLYHRIFRPQTGELAAPTHPPAWRASHPNRPPPRLPAPPATCTEPRIDLTVILLAAMTYGSALTRRAPLLLHAAAAAACRPACPPPRPDRLPLCATGKPRTPAPPTPSLPPRTIVLYFAIGSAFLPGHPAWCTLLIWASGMLGAYIAHLVGAGWWVPAGGCRLVGRLVGRRRAGGRRAAGALAASQALHDGDVHALPPPPHARAGLHAQGHRHDVRGAAAGERALERHLSLPRGASLFLSFLGGAAGSCGRTNTPATSPP